VSTWLYSIAKNCVIDYFRSRKITESIDDENIGSYLKVDFDEQLCLIADENRRLLYNALSQLDERTRDIIARKYFFDKSIRQIATDKQMNESSVSTIHNRGLKKLRKILDDV
jgi:RNA polymerase sigma-70 factor (ECF subfamily)